MGRRKKENFEDIYSELDALGYRTYVFNTVSAKIKNEISFDDLSLTEKIFRSIEVEDQINQYIIEHMTLTNIRQLILENDIKSAKKLAKHIKLSNEDFEKIVQALFA